MRGGEEKEKEKKEKKRKKGKKMRRKSRAWRRGERKRKKKIDTSLCDLRLTGGRNSSKQEAKLVYAIKATRGYQNPNFSLKFQKVEVSPTLVISCLVAM